MPKPFEKGDSRINRQGRPRKGMTLTDALEKHLKKKREDGTKNSDALAATLIELAIKDKNIHAVKYIMDRVDGRPKETVELTDNATDNRLREILHGE